MRPQGVALPILNLSVWLEKKIEIVQKIRVAIGPSGPVPKRITQVEDFLTGKSLADINFDEVNDILRSTNSFRTSPRRASAEYRYLVCKDLFADVFKKAWVSAAE
jgi:carbon-monoxide dehydrogenase medium subunit